MLPGHFLVQLCLLCTMHFRFPFSSSKARLAASFILGLAIIFIAGSCSQGKKNLPDVSGSKIGLETFAFEQQLLKIDSANALAVTGNIFKKYPSFSADYFYNILGLPPFPDSVAAGTVQFLKAYRPIIDSARQIIPSLKPQYAQIELALKYCQHYFPAYKLPTKLYTFIGPFDGYGSVLTQDGFGVGLQLYLGPQFSVYKTGYVQSFYPAYRSRRFSKEYIPVDCIRNLVADLHPALPPGKNLLEQMVDLGKRLYLVDYLLPHVADTLKTGYTAAQLKSCYENEAVLWNFYVGNDLLYKTDPALLRDYLNDAPNTPAFGDGSPGNIAQFTGWQMVKAWAAKTGNETNMQQLLATPAAQILKESGYKPR